MAAKQPPLLWYLKLGEILEAGDDSSGLHRDRALYQIVDERGACYVLLYVDDILLVSDSTEIRQNRNGRPPKSFHHQIRGQGCTLPSVSMWPSTIGPEDLLSQSVKRSIVQPIKRNSFCVNL